MPDSQSPQRSIVTDTNLQAHFHESINDALSNQSLVAQEDTIQYLVYLLASFLHTNCLFEEIEEGLDLRPLAVHYADAVFSTDSESRVRALRRMGDLALFISGVFSDSLNRKMVDMDYYIAMGGQAYDHLSDSLRGTARERALRSIYQELSTKFAEFVDVLAEVSEGGGIQNDVDILRTYEIWMRTGSRRAAGILRKLGIEPIDLNSKLVKH